jgi:hypothetical protein
VDQHKNQSTEFVQEKKDLTAQVLDWARDRTEALEGFSEASDVNHPQVMPQETPEETPKETSKETPQETPQETKTETSSRVVVVALHENTSDCGEAHLFEDLQAAGHFVETLVEDGLDQQRLSVFNCTQLSVHLTYRAVVHLKATEEQEASDA